MNRRRVLRAAIALVAWIPYTVRAQQRRVPIADMHSHYGMMTRKLGHVRSVVDHLEEMKLEASVIERLAYGNYARVLKAVLKS